MIPKSGTDYLPQHREIANHLNPNRVRLFPAVGSWSNRFEYRRLWSAVTQRSRRFRAGTRETSSNAASSSCTAESGDSALLRHRPPKDADAKLRTYPNMSAIV